MPIYVFGQMINSFDSEPGETYWSYESSENADPALSYVNNSIVSDPVIEGTGAMQLDYSAHNIEAWGGYSKIYHMHPDIGEVWDWSGYDSISFSYYNSVPQTSTGSQTVHLRLNLSDYGDITVSSYTGLGEYYYSFHYILDNDPGWNTITMPLVRNDSWDGGGFNLTGWIGDAGNGELDKDAIAGFHFEFSIDGGGDGTYNQGTIILDDFKLTGSNNVLTNPGFELADEQDDDFGWGVAMGGGHAEIVTDAAMAHSGDNYFHVGVTDNWAVGYTEGVIPAEFGETWRFSGYAKSISGIDGDFGAFKLEAKDVGGTVLGTTGDVFLPITDEWGLHSLEFVMPEGATQVTAVIVASRWDGSACDYVFDDMFLTNMGALDVIPPDPVQNVGAVPASYYNLVNWSDNDGEEGETYNVYASTEPITDLSSPAVDVVAANVLEGEQAAVHYLYFPLEDAEVTYYYAVACMDASNNVGEPGASSGSITNTALGVPTISLEPPADFAADGDLAEWYDSGIVPFELGATDNSYGTPHLGFGTVDDDNDLYGTIYTAVDDDYFYVAAEIVDNVVNNDASAGWWTADVVQLCFGFYDQRGPKHVGMQRGAEPDYKMYFTPAGANSDNGAGMLAEHGDGNYFHEVFNPGYVFEFRISLDAILIDDDVRLIPADGMRTPFEPMVYDNDGAGLEAIMVLSPTNDDNAHQTCEVWSNTWIGSTYTTNTLLNGSFEDGMNFWSTWNVNGNTTISTTGESIYNSSAVFEAYDGEQALKMWGAYNGYETYTWVGQFLEVGSGGLEIGSLVMLDGMMMSHADDWIGQGANYACLALYFYDADMTTYVGGQYMALSEFVDASAPSSEWLYRDVIAQIPEGTVWAWAGVEYYQPSNDDHGSIYVDMLQTDVNVTGGIPAELSVAEAAAVHGDTVLVDIFIDEVTSELSSIDLSFAGFHGKLTMVDIIADGSSLMGSNGWAIQYNDTEDLLITAAAGAQDIDQSGKLFSLKLAVNDTVASQFVPVEIVHYLGNDNLEEYIATSGGVQVVWGPTANFISDTTTGYLPLTVFFTDTSTAGTYDINQWVWDFGDDATAEGTNVQHTYYQDGNYTVTLVVTDEFGLTDTLTMVDYIIALHPVYPQAGFSASLTSGDYPLTVAFTDTSQAGTYAITNWIWDFGNDSTGTGTDVSMSYHRPGVYDVSLTVIDEYSLSDTLINYSYIQVDTVFGDIDFNAIMETEDAYTVLSHVVGLTELDSLEFVIADVSTNSSLSPLDATLILQYLNGDIAVLPFVPGPGFEATGQIQMEDQDADPDMMLDIPVNLTNGSNIYGFTGTIHYDPAVVELDTILFSNALQNYLVIANPLSPGVIILSAAGIASAGESDVIAILSVYVTEAFSEATSITITDLSWNEGEAVELAAEMTINFGLSVDGLQLPDVYALHQNYPNPFNPFTTLRYDLPENAMVNITIYDMMGRVVKTMVNSEQEAGFKSIQWDGTNHAGATVSAGLYLYTIQAGSFHQTKKMILLK